MIQNNGSKNGVEVTEIIGGIKLITSEVNVQVPVFVEVPIDKPVYVAKEIEIPTGWDRVINALALELCDKIITHVTAQINTKLDAAIRGRLDTITVPKIVEELNVTYKDVAVERPVFTDVAIDRPVFKDKTIINPVTKDVEVINALIIDKPVLNAVINDIRVTNAIIKDVEVERAVIREKVVEVVHKNCIDASGNPIV